MIEKNSRRKRFLVHDEKDLSPHYSSPDEILTLAYEFSDETILEKVCRTSSSYLRAI